MEAKTEETVTAGSLSERDELLAVLVAGGKSIKDAGAELEISNRQAYRIASEPAFKAKVSEIRTELMQDALGSLAKFASSAVERLQELTLNDDPSVALRACTAILDRFGKLSESIDLRQRVEALEKRAVQ